MGTFLDVKEERKGDGGSDKECEGQRVAEGIV